MNQAIALLDNTSFAGVMRCYRPNLDMHVRFWSKYPEHKEVDEIALAEFLNAICLFDKIQLDSSSGEVQTEKELEGYPPEVTTGQREKSWVDELLPHLPSEVRELVEAVDRSYDSRLIDNEQARRSAYDTFCSPLQEQVRLKGGEKLPNVYYSESYVFRHEFVELNEKNNNQLDKELLAQAMFLHRGLYLEARARKEGLVYMPFLYRGKMLSAIPPLISEPPLSDGLRTARLPLAKGQRPNEDEYQRQLNSFYYELLKKVCWETYDDHVPFVGAAILSKASGDVNKSFEIALELRHQGGLRKRWDDLRHAVSARERGKYEAILKDIKKELEDAAMHLGANIRNPLINTFFNLATFWMPKDVDDAVKAAVELLPHYVRHWGNEVASHLLTKTPFQLLFIEHTKAIKGHLNVKLGSL